MIIRIRRNRRFEFRDTQFDGFIVGPRKKKISIFVSGTRHVARYSKELEGKLRSLVNKSIKS